MTALRLSNSEMVEFRRCRRKWYLHTYRWLHRKVDEEIGSAPRVGTLIHDALAAYYDPARREHPVAYAAGVFERALENRPEYESNLTKEWDLVKKMLEGYLEWLEETGADSDLNITGSETIGEVALRDVNGTDVGVNLISLLDAPVERISDGAKLALEHKSVQSFDQIEARYKLDTQFLTEHLVRFLDSIENGATNDEAMQSCQGVLVNMLRRVKRGPRATPPFYDRIDVLHNVHELRNHWRHVVSVAQEIQRTTARLDAGESHHTACPPNPAATCSWDCPFYYVCVMADDGSDFEAALAALYEERDPLERYTQAASDDPAVIESVMRKLRSESE